ncbi:helix-turn-helix domain-containing protein [Streptomyces sp. NPDC015232]|uniref:helix-turn-helix domain-containing protein n=1 Tax=unclassified Streptomyces TaxID=2593676 RepID=UPI0036F55CE2
MAGPGEVRSQQEFVQALRQLVSATGRSPEDIASRAGLSGNTVRGIVAGKNWPQQRTLEALVGACGQDSRRWVEAWEPLNEARPRPERGSDKQLQEQVETLEAEVGRLRERVRHLLDVVDRGEAGDRRRERRRADAYFAFLTQMPQPDFRRAEPRRSADDRALSPVVTYTEPAYTAFAVHSFLDTVKDLSTVEGLPKLALHLATSPLPAAISTVSAYGDNDAPHDYAKSDVDAYVTKLRTCVHQYLRDCTDVQPRGAEAARP